MFRRLIIFGLVTLRNIVGNFIVKSKIYKQRNKLKQYKNDIISTIDCKNKFNSSIWAIFVYFEPNGHISQSFINVSREMKAAKINLLVVCNYLPSEAQKEFISKNAHTLIVRGNQGFDFGAYKDTVAYLKQEYANDIERVILLNDSVYYFSTGLKKFVSEMSGPESTVSAFENWQHQHSYHLQSFAISVDKSVFFGKNFSKFWENYLPVSSRLYAIENGEKKLSKAILTDSISSRVVYTIGQLHSNLEIIAPKDEFEFMANTPIALRKISQNTLNLNKKSLNTNTERPNFVNKIKFTLLENVNGASPIHYGMNYFCAAGCPIVKKDIVFREVFKFWEVEIILSKYFNKIEVREFLGMIRLKGDTASLSLTNRMLYLVSEK